MLTSANVTALQSARLIRAATCRRCSAEFRTRVTTSALGHFMRFKMAPKSQYRSRNSDCISRAAPFAEASSTLVVVDPPDDGDR
jgi:hypothetical protein